MQQVNPLKIKNLLAATPKGQPKYNVQITNINGEGETLADPKATRALVALMNQHAVTGGAAAHWGGPAAFAEIMASTHAIMFREDNWTDHYNFVNDAGHAENGIYALRANYGFDNMKLEDLKGFRSIKSKLTGHGEAHLNPQGVMISNGPLGSGLPQAQGLCFADKLIGNDKVTICAISDGASMEGEAKESFAAIAGLAAKEKMNPFVLIISDNNTKLSGRISEDSFSMGPSFSSLESLGWNVIHVEEGHDLQIVHHNIEKAISSAKSNSSKPIALRIKTIKGYGVKSTMDSKSGGHGYPLKPYDANLPSFLQEIYHNECPEEFITWAKEVIQAKPADSSKGAATDQVKLEKVQPGIAKAAIKAAQDGLPVFSVSSDLQGSTGIAAFQKEFPNLTMDIGIAESNMVSMAAGMAKKGFIPMVDTFAQFGVTKGNLPITMANLSLAPVICLFSHTGFQDAADGASHQATTYFSAVSSIPHTTVVSCASSKEAEEYLGQAIRTYQNKVENGEVPDSYVFFYGRENFPHYYNENISYQFGKAQVLEQGDAACVVATGPTVAKALLAQKELAKEGINITVVNNPFVNKPDLEVIGSALKGAGNKLVTVEDHQIKGGMGSLLVHELKMSGHNCSVKSLGILGEFGQSAYKADHLYAKNLMDDQAIIKAVKELL
jgi:transketolase